MLETSDFKCEDLGVQNIDVYDIEVEDNHNFFANNICVHNSLYICVDKLVQKMFPDTNTDINKITNFIDKFVSTKIEEEIHRAFEDFRYKLNHRQNLVSFKREAIADKAVFRSKKRYFMNVIDNEGVRYSTPELKVMGIEVVKSSTPRFCRDKLKEALKMILKDDESALRKFIRQCKKDFKAAPLEDIAFPRGVSDMIKYQVEEGSLEFNKGTPIHVRASMVYNTMLEENNMTHVERISSSSKIKFIYLKTPNHTRSNVIAFTEDLPIEFGLHKYIDYNTQFDKSFIEPLKSITDILKWNINPNSLNFA